MLPCWYRSRCRNGFGIRFWNLLDRLGATRQWVRKGHDEAFQTISPSSWQRAGIRFVHPKNVSKKVVERSWVKKKALMAASTKVVDEGCRPICAEGQRRNSSTDLQRKAAGKAVDERSGPSSGAARSSGPTSPSGSTR